MITSFTEPPPFRAPVDERRTCVMFGQCAVSPFSSSSERDNDSKSTLNSESADMSIYSQHHGKWRSFTNTSTHSFTDTTLQPCPLNSHPVMSEIESRPHHLGATRARLRLRFSLPQKHPASSAPTRDRPHPHISNECSPMSPILRS